MPYYPPPVTGAVGANPTASVGLTAVNGSAVTFMRSDAAPPLDQTAAYAFTGLGATTISANGALNAPALRLTGTIVTGGTGATTKPLFLIASSGAPSNNWSTSGTVIGVDTPSGFTGRVLALDVNGFDIFTVDYLGNVVPSGNLNGNGAIRGGSSSQIYWSGRATMDSPADGQWRLMNNVGSTSFILTAPGTAIAQLGAASAASPVAQTIKVQDATTGNNNGAATFTQIASLSVGNGTSGDWVVATGKNGNGSGVLATATTALTIKGETQAVVVASGKNFQVGNAFVGTPQVSTGYIVIYDNTGTAYKVSCNL